MIKILNKVKKESINGDYDTAYVSYDPIKIETDYGIQCNNLFTKVRIGSKPKSNALGFDCSFSSNNTTIPTNGLVAYYPFDGDTKDHYGNNDGVIHGTEQYEVSKFGKAFKFDGNTYIDIGSKTFHNLINTQGSFCFWINILNFKNKHNSFFSAIDNSKGNNWDYYFNIVNNGDIDIALENNLTDYHFTYSANIQLNIWYHICIIFDNKNISLFLNGKLVKKFTDKFNNINNNTNDTFNAINDNYKFDGLINAVRIYNRALTEDEIIALYNENNIQKNNQNFGIWIYNDYLNVKNNLNPEIIEPNFPITENFDKYIVAYCDKNDKQDCKLIFKAKNLVPGKKYKLLFGIGAFDSVDEYDSENGDHFEIIINNQSFKFQRENDRSNKLLTIDKKFVKTGKSYPNSGLKGEDNEYPTTIWENIPIEFIASNTEENIIIHFITDQEFEDERWAYIVNSMKIIEE